MAEPTGACNASCFQVFSAYPGNEAESRFLMDVKLQDFGTGSIIIRKKGKSHAKIYLTSFLSIVVMDLIFFPVC